MRKNGTYRKFVRLIRKILCLAAVLCCLFSGSIPAEEQNHRVLFIASYSYDWPSQPLFINGFKDAVGSNVDIRYVFMNTKQVDSAVAERITHDTLLPQYAAEPQPYDAVFVSDDAALDFVIKYRQEFFSGLPIIFTGINSVEKAENIALDPLITGVIETFPIRETVDIAKKLTPSATTVVGITDQSVSGQGSTQQFLSQQTFFPELQFTLLDCSAMTKTEIIQKLSSFDKTVIPLFLIFSYDRSGQRYTFADGIRLVTQFSPVPVYRSDETGMGMGLLGGDEASYYEMGYDGGLMLRHVFEGTPIKSMPPIQAPHQLRFDKKVMDRFGISKRDLPSQTIYINDQQSFWVRYRTLILVGGGISIVAALIIVFFILDNRRYRRLLRQLRTGEDSLNTAIHHSGIHLWQYDPVAHRVQHLTPTNEHSEEPNVIDNYPQSYIEDRYVYPDDIPAFLAIHTQMDEGAKEASCRVRIRYGQEYRWECIRYTAFYNKHETLLQILGSATDITEQRQAEQRYKNEIMRRQTLEKDIVQTFFFNVTQNCLIERRKQGKRKDEEIGQTMEEGLRRELQRIWPPHRQLFMDRFVPVKLLQNYQDNVRDFGMEYKMYRAGRWFWMTLHGKLIQEPDKKNIILFLYVRDIDEAKKDELALKQVLEDDVDCISCLDVKTEMGHMLKAVRSLECFYTNEGVKYFSYKTAFQKLIAEIIPEDRKLYADRFSLAALRQELSQSKECRLSFRMLTGEIIRYKAIRAFYLAENDDTIVFVQRDVTDLYEEEERQKRKLTAALEAAKQASRAKSDFLSRMSHEIRTPMNAIIGLTALSQERISDNKYIHENLGKINSAAHFLLSLINDILDISRIEQGKMQLNNTVVLFQDFLDEIHALIQERAKEKQIRYEEVISDSMKKTYVFDSLKLKQVIINILSNAVKFTSCGGLVRFTVKQQNIQKGFASLYFVVEDTGIGINPQFLPHLFDAFEQEYAKNTTLYGGTGLGLAISKNIIELMGGTISVKSEKDRGTTFTVQVTVPTASEEAIARPEYSGYKDGHDFDFHGCRALLVEDNDINREIAQCILEDKGFIVDIARDGDEAVQAFKKQPANNYYDVILMDVRMPHKDGLTAAREIRSSQRPDGKTIPILAMTANAFEEDVRRSLAAGMNGHLIKPIETMELYRTLERVIKRS